MLQSLLNGLIHGLLFAVLGVAFSLVHSTTRVLHLGLGATYVAAPYVLLAAVGAGLGWTVGVTLALGAAAVLGLAAEEVIHWPLECRRAPSEIHLIAALGGFMVVTQTVVLVWGNDTQALRSGIDTVYDAGGLHLTHGQVGAAVACALALACTFAWLRWTNLGLEFRAMASNAALLATLGRDVRRLRRVVFSLAGALAAVAGLAAARDVGFDPHVGMRAVLLGVAAAIVGGRGSLAGAAVAGLLLGALRAQVVWHTSARWEDAATFALLAGILLFAPGGLRGLTRGAARLEEAR